MGCPQEITNCNDSKKQVYKRRFTGIGFRKQDNTSQDKNYNKINLLWFYLLKTSALDNST
jgi:hypothetical protein